MKVMRAVQLAAHGDASSLKLSNIIIPSPLSNQLLVKNSFAGVNFIDTYQRSGLYKVAMPFIPGRYHIAQRLMV